MKIKRIPYKIADAAKETDLSIHDLIHYGVMGSLKIAAYFTMTGRKVGAHPDNTDEYSRFFDGLYYLHKDDLRKFAFDREVDVIGIYRIFPIDPRKYDNAGYRPVDYINNTALEYHEFELPYKVDYKELYILGDDLSQFIITEALCQKSDPMIDVEQYSIDEYNESIVNGNNGDINCYGINKGGRPPGQLREVIELIYFKHINNSDIEILKPYNSRMFVEKLKEYFDKSKSLFDGKQGKSKNISEKVVNNNEDIVFYNYIYNRLEDVKVRNSSCRILTKEQIVRIVGNRETKDKGTPYDQTAVSTHLCILRKEYPLPK